MDFDFDFLTFDFDFDFDLVCKLGMFRSNTRRHSQIFLGGVHSPPQIFLGPWLFDFDF